MDDIANYLESIEREKNYRVDCILKQSPTETTERVFYRREDGTETGPYIRKYFQRDSGMGKAYQRLYEAGKAGRRFKHLPFVYEYYQGDSSTVVVMEHVNGQTLGDLVYRRDASLQLAIQLFPLICDAVSELHESFDPPLIHRDLKPSNIIVRNEVPVIIDFGISREYHDDAETDTTHLGTRAYAPPEQFGFEQTTVRSDVYALGMLLYFLLLEQTPNSKVVQRHFDDSRIPLRIQEVLVRATAFDPQQRYESAASLKAAFLEAVGLAESGSDGANPRIPKAAPVLGEAPRRPAMSTPPGSGAEGCYPTSYAYWAQEAPPPHYPSAPLTTETPPRIQGLPPKRRGVVRNVTVIVFFGLFVIVSWLIGFDPSRATVQYPPVFHAFAYFFFVPIFCAAIAYTLLDKRGLRQRFPDVPWLSGWGTVLLLVMVFGVLMGLYIILGVATGVL